MLLIRGAEVYRNDSRGQILDVRCASGHVLDVAAHLDPLPGEAVLDAGGNALLPGLHDHHIHLFSLAAAARSVPCGPPAVTNREQLAHALTTAPGGGWVRGVGYHESVAGLLTAKALDDLLPHRPVRIQHRSGKLWLLNSAAMALLGVHRHAHLPGVVTAGSGPTGQLFRLDAWLADRLERTDPPDVAAASAQLASYGITGITDATPGNDRRTLHDYAGMIDRGRLLQRVRLMGGDDLAGVDTSETHPLLAAGERKILLDEWALPDFETLVSTIDGAHASGRAVAIHCVTRTELVFALAALREATASAPEPGDRIEHAAVVPADTVPLLRETGVTVVTQPGLVTERGDQYRADVAPREHPLLYRWRTLADAGVPVAASSDAPFTGTNPWLAMQGAVTRRTASGFLLGQDERVSPEQALAGFCTRAEDPGGTPRSIVPGAVADLCLLDRPWGQARRDLGRCRVNATLRGGELIFAGR
jgi:predicted amidohydrolase YtcJ